MSLFAQATALANLYAAWDKVRRNDGSAGVDGVDIEDFAFALNTNLTRLQKDLQAKKYAPKPLLQVLIAKEDGSERPLAIPTVRDRVAMTAVSLVLVPLFERHFDNASYGYRPGRSAEHATLRVQQLYDQGYKWVVDADIEDFFNQVDHSILFNRLREWVHDDALVRLITLWVRAKIRSGEKFITPTKGLPQGSPISPLLANMYLDAFDDRLAAKGMRFVRYADDFLLLCKDEPSAKQAFMDAGILLADLQLRLKYRKSRVTSFAAGFEYLGALFQGALVIPPRARNDPASKKTLPSEDVALSDDFMPVRPVRSSGRMPEPGRIGHPGYPETSSPWHEGREDDDDVGAGSEASDPVYAEADISDSYHPFMRTLYVQQQGSLLTKDGSRFVVTYRGEPLASIPVVKVAQIMVFGNAHLTTPVLKHCLLTGTPVTFLSRRGNYYGRLDNPLLVSPSLQAAQFATYHDERRRLALAKSLLRAKISNSRALLMRQRRIKRLKQPLLSETIDALLDYHNRLQHAKDIAQALGFEGAAAKAYFRVMGEIINPAFTFTGRHKRPPTDPVNSLLSFGYSLLYYNMLALVHACGLHPYVGSLHAINDQHASLVSDMIEPFRAPIIDGLVFYLVNKRILKPKDFYFPEDAEGACLLTNSARKTFIQHFEARLARKTRHPPTGYHVDWRRNMHYYVESYAQYVRGDRDFYEAFYHHQ